jgi:hypothetical protein
MAVPFLCLPRCRWSERPAALFVLADEFLKQLSLFSAEEISQIVMDEIEGAALRPSLNNKEERSAGGISGSRLLRRMRPRSIWILHNVALQSFPDMLARSGALPLSDRFSV